MANLFKKKRREKQKTNAKHFERSRVYFSICRVLRKSCRSQGPDARPRDNAKARPQPERNGTLFSHNVKSKPPYPL
jgi:hypothetical protein